MAARFRIGEWDVDPAARLLTQANHQVKLSPRAMDVLGFLSKRPGDIVSADELLSECWPHTIRSPNAVAKVVTELRHALGGKQSDSARIETIPKRGYRLLLPSAPQSVSTEDLAPTQRISSLTAEACVIRFGSHAAVLVPPTDGADDAALLLQAQQELRAQAGQRARVAVETVRVSVHIDEGSLRGVVAADYSVTLRIDKTSGAIQATLFMIPEDSGLPSHRQRFEAPADQSSAMIEQAISGLLDALSVLLDDGQLAQMREWGTRNVRAYEYAREAMTQHLEWSRSSIESAEQLFRQAILEDPGFAFAYARLGNVYHDLGWLSRDTESREAVRLRLEAFLQGARRQRIEPAAILHLERQFRLLSAANPFDAGAVCQAALQKEPLNPQAWRRFGDLLLGARLIDESERYLERAIALVPEKERFWVEQDASARTHARGDFERAITQMKANLERFPDHTLHLYALVRDLGKLGRFPEAELFLARLQATDQGWGFLGKLALHALRGDVRPGSNLLGQLFADPLANNTNRGITSFMIGDVEAGVRYWQEVEPAFLPLLWQFTVQLEWFYPPEVVADSRYQALLDELGFGRRWQAWMRERAIELAPVTGIAVTTPGPFDENRP